MDKIHLVRPHTPYRTIFLKSANQQAWKNSANLNAMKHTLANSARLNGAFPTNLQKTHISVCNWMSSSLVRLSNSKTDFFRYHSIRKPAEKFPERKVLRALLYATGKG
jgi:hypothetical protein